MCVGLSTARASVPTNFSIGELLRTERYSTVRRGGEAFCTHYYFNWKISAYRYGTVRRGAAAKRFVRTNFSIGKLVSAVPYGTYCL